MANENFKSSSERLTRAFAARARAMSRMWASEAGGVGVPQQAAEHDAIVDCALYIDGIRQHKENGILDYQEALEEAQATRGAFVWLGLYAPSERQMIGIADAFGLHELAVED